MTESLVFLKTEYTFAVSGREPMADVFNVKSGMFDPEIVSVIVEEDNFGEVTKRRVDVNVHGPMLRNGNRLKTKRGIQRYDLDYFQDGFLEEQRPPEWIFDILRGLQMLPPKENPAGLDWKSFASELGEKWRAETPVGFYTTYQMIDGVNQGKWLLTHLRGEKKDVLGTSYLDKETAQGAARAHANTLIAMES